MNKRVMNLFLLLGMTVLLSSFVQASVFGDILNKMGQLLFLDFLAAGTWGFKFLFWIILFSIINYGLGKANFDAKVAGTISLTISLIVVILTPGDAIVAVFSIFQKTTILILGIIVPLILGYVIHNLFKGKSSWEIFMRAAMHIIIGYALVTFAQNAIIILGSVI